MVKEYLKRGLLIKAFSWMTSEFDLDLLQIIIGG